ncbi:MAG: DNA gyrase subunit A [Desulfitobacteriaceae bacterium]
MSVPSENITQRPFEEILPEAFLSYSKFVALHRAIPDVRDGLKPVHRRILFSMNELGMHPDKPYSKAARLIGDCMAKYHPHGDSSIYESAVRMSQPWASRYPFVDGHGNFGSIDGDSAAAMRYTEMRMSPLALLMVQDIEKNTIAFKPNYDEKLKEPIVLPSPIPNILLNGGSGIAVGMASNMPPHNLKEVIEGVLLQIDNPKVTVGELMQKIPGPDFPTGGFIIGTAGIEEAYNTGRGKIIIRAKAVLEASRNGKSLIVVTEMPYGLSKSTLASKIEQLAEDKISGIAEVRDESDREGIRLVVECRKDADAQLILKQLYKETELQKTFGIINLVISTKGTPEVMGLKQIIAAFIEHRKQVVTRRTKYELAKAKARAHILEAIVVAINKLDEVIAIIRASKNPAQAKLRLMERFDFTEIQAQAILDMKLQHLTNLELEGIKQEYEAILKLIASLEEILADISKVYAIIKNELKEISSKYSDDRRTKLLSSEAAAATDMTIFEDPEKPIVVFMTDQNFIKQMPTQSRKIPNLSSKDGDYVSSRVTCSSRDTLFLFSDQGKAYPLSAKLLSEGSGKDHGVSVRSFVQIPEGERIIDLVPVKDFEANNHFLFVTRGGQVMRTPVTDYINARSSEAMTIKEGDALVRVFRTKGKNNLIIATAQGQFIRFPESEISPMGRKSRGVKGITLASKDFVRDALVLESIDQDIIIATERGYVKRSSLDEFKPQGRAGKGIAFGKIEINKTGLLAGIHMVRESTISFIQKSGTVTVVKLGDLQLENRAKPGVPMVGVLFDDYVVKSI